MLVLMLVWQVVLVWVPMLVVKRLVLLRSCLRGLLRLRLLLDA